MSLVETPCNLVPPPQRDGTTLASNMCMVSEAELSENFGSRLLIDALAINQSDTHERSEQVKLMGDIYQKATRVVIWIGPEDASTLKATTLMNGWLKLDSDERLNLHPAEVAVGHTNELLDTNSWQALAQFFQREWFNRAWMYVDM